MTYSDVWNWSIPVQEKYRISKIDAFKDVAAFYVYKGEKRLTVEIERIGFCQLLLFVTGEEAILTSPKEIRKDMLFMIETALDK